MSDRIFAPEGWKHVRGYHLRGDGQAIEYHNGMLGLTAYIEAMVNEDPDDQVDFEYRPSIIGADGVFIEYPAAITDKQEALDQLRDWMEEHN